MNASKVFMSNGTTFADALAGSVLAAKQKHPLLLVQAGSLPTPVADVVAKKEHSLLLCLGDHLDHGFIEK